MRGFWGLALLAVLAVLAVRYAAAAVDVRLRSLSTETGAAFNWQVTSTLVSPKNITLYGNQTATATYKVVAQRVPAGNGYTISGRVVIVNAPDSAESATIGSVKVMLGPGLPLLGPTPRTLDCKSREIVPGDSVSCAFKLHMSTTSVKTIRPSVDLRGQRGALVGEVIDIEFPAEPSASVSTCATIKDQIVADGAEKGMKLTASTKEAEALLDQGAEVCQDSTEFTYTAAMGPFTDKNVCGSYQFKNAPQVAVTGIGSASVTPAAGQLIVSGCRQKDMLGLLKPDIAISKLTLGQMTNSSWTMTTNSSLGDGSAAAGTAEVKYDSSVVVKSILNIAKTSTAADNGLVGEITLTNNQLVPYPIAGVRLVVTKDSSSSSGASSNSTATVAAAGEEAAASPEQLVVDVSCPMNSQGTIMVPPQLISSMPGVLRCSYSIPVEASLQSGTIQAQYKTLITQTFEVDSGIPTPFTFVNSTGLDPSSCVDVYVKRVMNGSEVTQADRDSNPDLASTLASMEGERYRFAAAKRVVEGRMPPAQAGLLTMPYTVCDNKTIEWAESFGPFTTNDCGTSMSVVAVTVKPKGTLQQAINTSLSFPVKVKECGVVPVVSIAELQLTAKKVFKWDVAKTATPAEGLTLLRSEQQGLVKYDINYTRTSTLTGYKLQGLVGLINTQANPIGVAKVLYSVSRPEGQAPLTGIAVCNETFTGAAHAALDVAAAQAAQAMSGNASDATDTLPGLKNAVTSFTLPAAPAAAAGDTENTAETFSILNVDLKSGGAAAAAEDTEGPSPYYCSFVMPVPDGFASEVAVKVLTDRGEEVTAQAPAAVDWSAATFYESGRCAQVSSTFQQTQPATLLKPSSVTGAMPPAPDKAARVCEPATYSFFAMFGPFDQCGDLQAVNNAGVSIPGLQNLTTDSSITTIKVTGCPDALPVLTMAPAAATQIISSYDWSLERSMKPLAPAAANAVVQTAAANIHTAPPAVVSVAAAAGSVALFNQTISVRRSPPVLYTGANQKFQIRGTVSIVNPGDKMLQVSEVQVKLIQPDVAKFVTVKANCPAALIKPAISPAKGTVIVIPTATAAVQQVNCNYGAMLSSNAPVQVLAVAVMATDGRWAKTGNSLQVDLSDVAQVSVGGCVRVSETHNTVDVANQTLADASFVGNRVPKVPEQVCNNRTYQAIGQIGPLKAAVNSSSSSKSRLAGSSQAAGCGAVRYNSVVSAEPTSGYQGKLTSMGELAVDIMGCRKKK